MRKIENIEKQVSDFQAQVNALMEQKSDAEKSLEAARRKYSASIVNAESAEQNAAYRKEVTELTVDVDALAGAVSLVEEDLRKAENEKEIVHLFKTEGTRHNNQMALVEESISEINADLPKLKNLVSELTSAVKGAFSGVELAASSLNGLSTDLDESLSLESFLEGHLTAVGDESREDLLNDIGNDLRDSVGGLVAPEDIDPAELMDLLEQMKKWKAVVTTFEGVGLIRNPKRLYGKISKRPATQRITVPVIPHKNTEAEFGRPMAPTPKFDRNRPHGRQQVLP